LANFLIPLINFGAGRGGGIRAIYTSSDQGFNESNSLLRTRATTTSNKTLQLTFHLKCQQQLGKTLAGTNMFVSAQELKFFVHKVLDSPAPHSAGEFYLQG